jgi:hypothetical protein
MTASVSFLKACSAQLPMIASPSPFSAIRRMGLPSLDIFVQVMKNACRRILSSNRMVRSVCKVNDDRSRLASYRAVRKSLRGVMAQKSFVIGARRFGSRWARRCAHRRRVGRKWRRGTARCIVPWSIDAVDLNSTLKGSGTKWDIVHHELLSPHVSSTLCLLGRRSCVHTKLPSIEPCDPEPNGNNKHLEQAHE